MVTYLYELSGFAVKVACPPLEIDVVGKVPLVADKVILVEFVACCEAYLIHHIIASICCRISGSTSGKKSAYCYIICR